MSYTIGTAGFVRWEGPRPQLVKQHTREFTKPGQDAISTQLMGTFGDPFQVRLSAVFASQILAQSAEAAYRLYIGTTQVLVHEGVNYSSSYSTAYFVKDVVVQESKRHVRLIGPTYDYPGGWKVVSDWVLIPIAVS